jgi:hypothetical protein
MEPAGLSARTLRAQLKACAARGVGTADMQISVRSPAHLGAARIGR